MKASNGLSFELANANSVTFSKIDRLLQKL
jgi:hypothetical protein